MKLLVAPVALVAYALWFWPRSLVEASAARRRLRAGKVRTLSLHPNVRSW